MSVKWLIKRSLKYFTNSFIIYLIYKKIVRNKTFQVKRTTDKAVIQSYRLTGRFKSEFHNYDSSQVNWFSGHSPFAEYIIFSISYHVRLGIIFFV
jgi:hypothetical protein